MVSSADGLPPDDPARMELANEVHARPSEPISTPALISWVAVRVALEERGAEIEHIASLCSHFGVAPPILGDVHFSGEMGPLRVRWERHGEFSSLMFQTDGEAVLARPIEVLPPGWLSAFPGKTFFAAHAELLAAEQDPPDLAALDDRFTGGVPVGAAIGGGGAWIFTDFRVQPDRYSRIIVFNRHLTARESGRLLQRLFEIETYRMLTLLALPLARQMTPTISLIERQLAELTGHIAAGSVPDERLLEELTRIAADLEHELARAQSRFGAATAYQELVTRRIRELREERLSGVQTIEEFMSRRFAPAVATISSVERRLRSLSERVAQVSMLLSTRVGITRERQNQALLASLNRRAEAQLHLQQAVEGFSVAAIVYYAAGLIAYCAKSLKASGVHLDVDVAVGASIPVVLLFTVWATRRAHRRISQHFTRAEDISL